MLTEDGWKKAHGKIRWVPAVVEQNFMKLKRDITL